MKRILFIILLLSLSVRYSMAGIGNASNPITEAGTVPGMIPKDFFPFDSIMKWQMNLAYLPSDELLLEVAKGFFEVPYVAGTLEGSPETLKVDIYKTDCILFVEQCVAITYLIKMAAKGIPGNDSMDTWAENVSEAEVPTFEDLVGQIQKMRYRDGKVDGYSSRLHYTSEWILQNEETGLMEEVTAELGGVPLDQKFSFMSEHSEAYAALKGNPGEIAKIRAVEEALNEAAEYFYIPAADIPEMEHLIKNGDLIFFTSKVDGLDITHCAIAYVLFDKDDLSKSLHFIHASSKAKKVIVEPKTLAEYTKTGIRVVRLNF